MAHWLNKILPTIRSNNKRRNTIPEGLWRKCPKCDAVLYKPELERALNVCTKCQHHLRIGSRKRIDITLDVEGREEIGSALEPIDKLKFKDSKRYKERISKAQKSTQEKDALVAMSGTIQGFPVAAVFFEFDFMGGSMGSVVGEKFVAAAQHALEKRIPLICFSASGGARMQEALFSLMQMAKTSAVLKRLKMAGIPYISVMTDPVYGGVSASIAMLGDVNLAEPNALIGFAGPRVIEQTVRQKLPEGFQRSEFLLEHGVLDMIVHRQDMRDTLVQLLSMMGYQLPAYVDILRERAVLGDDAYKDETREGMASDDASSSGNAMGAVSEEVKQGAAFDEEAPNSADSETTPKQGQGEYSVGLDPLTAETVTADDNSAVADSEKRASS